MTDTTPWDIVDTMFRSDKSVLVQHQINSYNKFILSQLPQIVEQYNPITVMHGYNEKHSKYETEVKIFFSNLTYNKPIIHENNGCTKPMTPAIARLRNLTYSSNIYVDIKLEVTVHSGSDLSVSTTTERKVGNVNIGKIPVMLMSELCVLNERTHQSLSLRGECKHELGGYFIINGSEKVLICQERQAENMVYCFKDKKSTKYSHIVEIRSVSQYRAMSPRTLTFKITAKEGLMGRLVYASFSKFKTDIPLFVLFRAFGVESDREIVEYIVGDVKDIKNAPLLQLLSPSLQESSSIITQEVAIEYLSKHIILHSYPKEQKLTDDKRVRMVKDILNNDILPHLGKDNFLKVHFIGKMIQRLMLFHLGFVKEDDRDSYAKKRVDTAGALLSNLTRQYLTKMIKEIRGGFVKEMNSGNWKYTKKIESLLNQTNLYKVIKTTTLESGLKYALATGTWGLKNAMSNRSSWTLGVAHVLNRLSYLATLSHLRRINTPIDKTSKLIEPRKLNGTQWGYICPCETPEGASIGVVKNMSMLSSITIEESPLQVSEVILKIPGVNPFNTANCKPETTVETIFILVNCKPIALTDEPVQVLRTLRDLRRKGMIHPHVSFLFHTIQRQIMVYTEGGRMIRPLLIVENGKDRFTPHTLTRLRDKTISWTELVLGYHDKDGNYHPSVIEYIDALESEHILIDMHFKLNKDYGKHTHIEIHPALIMGVVASTICFPEHNQSPRNTYQSAMGKQSMGIYTTNFSKRLDSMANVLNYPMKPFVQTRIGQIINQDNMPNAANSIVAIMSYSGFNQEDSLIICKDAVDRGFYHSTFYRTYKDDERKNSISGEEEKFTNPDPIRTKGLKPGSYNGLNKNGFIRPNVPLRGGDVIIGKTVPIRDVPKNNGEKAFHDQSTTLRHNESGISDCTFESRNGDGYRFVKVKVRSNRMPGIGDKFSSCHGQKGTVGNVFSQKDMPFIAKTGITPDIIINPHCIPSRMTMGQLYESILGKCGVHLGKRGDGTAFNKMSYSSICDLLEKCGMERHGNETLVHGQTGEQIPCAIFMGPIYEQRLKHMVEDKIHSRSTGPKVMLTRQPAEGRSRDGGLRIGEMERDCIIAHGAGSFLKERMLDMSDRYGMHISKKSGLISAVNKEKNICNTFEEDKCDMSVTELRLPYGFKLLSQELQAMSIATRLQTQ
jgi:DNA-directed RNA polymerase II subunit RPB2